MKCHILFSEKNKKNISKCRLLKILPRVLSVKIAMSRWADGRRASSEVYLFTFFKVIYYLYSEWIAFSFGRDEEEDL